MAVNGCEEVSRWRARRRTTSPASAPTSHFVWFDCHVFPHLEGPQRGTRIREFRKAWRKACRAAGLPGLLVHDLRRSAVRNLERAGVPRSTAMKMTGHKTESVYRRYAIVSDADLQDAARRLAIGRAPDMPASASAE